MRKNGITFSAIVDSDHFISGTWDPFFYKNKPTQNTLDKFVEINKQFNYKFSINTFKYSPIEYKDIPRGNSLVFNLNRNSEDHFTKCFAVPENTLLMGTMRAYLGNIIITPRSEWLSEKKTWFAINSEFCEIAPNDNLKYYWWAFLKSSVFLNNLPTGTGGTRPRVAVEQLSRIPILVPDLEERTEINESIENIAKRLWKDQMHLSEFIDSTI